MDDDEIIDRPESWEEQSKKHQTSPYELLIRQSRKIGATATKTYDVTREFLRQDVATLYPQQIIRSKTKKQTSTEKSDKKLNRMVSQASDVLASAQTVILPMNLFADTVTVDRTRVTITLRTFFWSANVITLSIEDILNVSCSVGPLFGSLNISSRVMSSTDHFEINYFWRKDAVHLKTIIQGYIIAVHNKVDTTSMSRDDLINKLSTLGRDPKSSA